MKLISRTPCPLPLINYLTHQDSHEYRSVNLYRKEKFFGNYDSKPFTMKYRIILIKELKRLFNNKCCYCESELGIVSEGEIEHFRPRSSMLNKKGKVSIAYRNLFYEWRNIYLSCPVCNRNKNTRFPLEGEQALGDWSYEQIIKFENPLLLDPCIDDPDEHIAISFDGRLIGLTKRGIITIETLILNRMALVSARKSEIQKFHEASSSKRLFNSKNAPYSLVWRQLLSGQSLSKHEYAENSEIARDQEDYEKSLSDFSTEGADEIDKEKYRAIARYIENVSIINFGAIEKLTLDLSAPSISKIPCFALLGENGVGKSTVLRAIAMTLSGKNYLKKLKLTSNHFLPSRAYSGEVRITCADGSEHLMVLCRNKPISLSSEKAQSLILAYGATRLLPTKNRKTKLGESHAKIDNLFNPFLPLTDPRTWLLEQSKERLTEVIRILNILLPVDQNLKLKITDEEVVKISICNDPLIGFSELSDGYQGMLGIAVDMMKILYDVYDSMESAQGIVLIDELGNHFHPAWRLQHVTALRKAFPNIQFIYSTHDPLCLRGLLEGEVAVLIRDKSRRVYALEELPSVDKLRVEQLLKSEHFGLRSTLDPVQEEKIREYERLLASVSRNEEQESNLDNLVKELTDEGYFGETRRERLALKLIDLESAVSIPSKSSISAENLSKSTISKLQLILNEVNKKDR